MKVVQDKKIHWVPSFKGCVVQILKTFTVLQLNVAALKSELLLTVVSPFGELCRYSVGGNTATATKTHKQVRLSKHPLGYIPSSPRGGSLFSSYLSTAPLSASLSRASPWSSPAPEQRMMSASVYWALPYSKVSSPSTSRSASLSPAPSLMLHVANPVPGDSENEMWTALLSRITLMEGFRIRAIQIVYYHSQH